MRVTLELPDNIQTLSPETQKEKLLQALQNVRNIKTKKAQPVSRQSKWRKIVNRVTNDPNHLGGYSEKLKKDIKEFRDNFEFEHDQ